MSFMGEYQIGKMNLDEQLDREARRAIAEHDEFERERLFDADDESDYEYIRVHPEAGVRQTPMNAARTTMVIRAVKNRIATRIANPQPIMKPSPVMEIINRLRKGRL